MKAREIIAWAFVVILLVMCVAIVKDKNKMESDICYSLKTNEILIDGWEREFNVSIESNQFRDILKTIQKKYWEGCE